MSRQLRAAIGIGIVWALAWLPVGAAVAAFANTRPPAPDDLLFRPISLGPFLAAWTLWGGLSGLGFATILAVAEQRRDLGGLAVTRTAAWGGLGAMVVPAGLVAIDVFRGLATSPLYDWQVPAVVVAASAALGSTGAALTLLVARRSGQRPERRS